MKTSEDVVGAEVSPRPEILQGTDDTTRARLSKLAFLFLSLVSVALVHLPWLPLEAQAVGHTFTNLTGQEVRWMMFSADPRGTSLDLWAEIDYRDGTSSTWVIQRDGAGGDFGFYRMVKWMESAVLDPKPGSLEGFAAWLVDVSDKPVTRVEIWTGQRLGSPPGVEPGQLQMEMVFAIEPEEHSGG